MRANNIAARGIKDCIECDQQDSRCGYRFPRSSEECPFNPKTQLRLSAYLPLVMIEAIEYTSYDQDVKHKLLYITNEIFSEFVTRKKMDITKPLRLPSYKVRKIVGRSENYKLFTQVLVDELGMFKPIENEDGTRYRLSTPDKAGCPIHYVIPKGYLSPEYDTVWFVKNTGGHKPKPPQFTDPALEQLHKDLEYVKSGIPWEEMEIVLKEVEDKIVNDHKRLITRKKLHGKPRKDGKKYQYTYDDGKVEITSLEGTIHLAKQLADRRISQHRNALNKVYNPQYRNRIPFRDPKSYRLFHPYVNLPKDYWEHLTIKGERVREIDASNCQPMLIAQLIKRYSEEAVDTEELIDKVAKHVIDLLIHLTIWHNRKRPRPNGKTNPYINIWKACNDNQLVESSVGNGEIAQSVPYLFYHLDSIDGLDHLDNLCRNRDLSEWARAAIEGKLYERETYQIYCKTPESPDYKGFKGKVQTLKFMYSDPAYNVNSYDLKDFRKGYNQTFSFLNAVKVRIGELFSTYEGNKVLKSMILESKLKSDHSTITKIGSVLLSIAIQAMESYIFIDHILPRLQAEGIIAIPKHDAVLVADSDYDRARELVEEVLLRFFGWNEDYEPNFHLK